MPVSMPVLFKITLVTAGGHNGLVGDGQSHHGSVWIFRVLDADDPGGSVRLRTDCLYISAKVQKRGSDTFVAQCPGCKFTCIALGNTAKINGHTFRNCDISRCFVILDLCVIYFSQKRLNCLLVRNLIASGCKSPCFYDWVDGNIQSTVGTPAHFKSIFHQSVSFTA